MKINELSVKVMIIFSLILMLNKAEFSFNTPENFLQTSPS